MILELLTVNNLSDAPLSADRWQRATCYAFHTGSIFWNTAVYISLAKSETSVVTDALLSLLQKEAKTLSLWKEEWIQKPPTLNEFLRSLQAWGRLKNTHAQMVMIEDFWKSFVLTIDGLRSEPSFEFCKEGNPIRYTDLLRKEDMVKAIAFTNSWQEQDFFIETTKEWILFHWTTGA